MFSLIKRMLNKLSSLQEGLNLYFNKHDKQLGAIFNLSKPHKPIAYIFNVAPWKRQITRSYLDDYRVIFLPNNYDVDKLSLSIKFRLRKPIFIIWGRSTPSQLKEFSLLFEIEIHHIEDGFLRSIGLGADGNLPYSICYDKTGLYYDSLSPSDLESILSNYDFKSDSQLLIRAETCLKKINDLKLSKYNEKTADVAEIIYGPKVRKRVLVIGQVEDDQSLIYGSKEILSNRELISKVLEENPIAQVIYKPHPDILAGLRKEISNVKDFKGRIEVIDIPVSLHDALFEVDHVYTMTSLAGFEALIKGCKVTTFGAPFYSGWGLTDDREKVERRVRKLSLEELFAGAYILYPKYLDPKSKKKLELESVIDMFSEELNCVQIVKPENFLNDTVFINLSTNHPVDSKFISNSTSKNIAIISDSPNSILIAKGLALNGIKVSLFTTRDALANEHSMLLTVEENEKIEVLSLHKKFGVPLSDCEKLASNFVEIFAEVSVAVLSDICCPHLSRDVIDAIVEGLKDYAYHESLRYYAVQSCILNFQKTIIYIDDLNANNDVIRSAYLHGKSEDSLGSVYLNITKNRTKIYINELLAASFNEIEGSSSLSSDEIRALFSKFWWSLNLDVKDEFSHISECAVVCGNIQNDNYAYSPTTLKVIDLIRRKFNYPVVYFSSTLLNFGAQEEIKLSTLKNNLNNGVVVYRGNPKIYKKKYENLYEDGSVIFEKYVVEKFIFLLGQRLPISLISIFSARLSKYLGGVFHQVFFVAEVEALISRAKIFTTTMERAHISRILTATSKSRKIPTLGFQPQIISSSLRYRKPMVERMGVIDTSQVEVYSKIGADTDNLRVIGSVNIIERLIDLDNKSLSYRGSPQKKSIVFALQHSMSNNMLATAIALKNICKNHNYQLIVKPHPHQELPILNKIKAIYHDLDTAIILGRDSDTYDAIAKSSIIVGAFSSVLLESALFGKDVIVSCLVGDIDTSVDFSRLGLAVRVSSQDELDCTINDLFVNGSISRSLRDSRVRYLDKNPQFKAPYSNIYFDKFLSDSVLH